MRLLLDTCTLLWIAAGSDRLSARALSLFADPGNTVLLSAASAWEIAVKHRLGRLPLPAPPQALLPELRDTYGLVPLPLAEEAAVLDAGLPDLHRDPFDRMLVCQAMAEGLVILTPDEQIARYPVRTAW